jgi:hypothetical protein
MLASVTVNMRRTACAVVMAGAGPWCASILSSALVVEPFSVDERGELVASFAADMLMQFERRKRSAPGSWSGAVDVVRRNGRHRN